MANGRPALFVLVLTSMKAAVRTCPDGGELPRMRPGMRPTGCERLPTQDQRPEQMATRSNTVLFLPHAGDLQVLQELDAKVPDGLVEQGQHSHPFGIRTPEPAVHEQLPDGFPSREYAIAFPDDLGFDQPLLTGADSDEVALGLRVFLTS